MNFEAKSPLSEDHPVDSQLENVNGMKQDLQRTLTDNSGFADGTTSPPFKWSFDIVTNLIALWACFFSSTWLLVVPSSIIGFIIPAFPSESDKAIWIAASPIIANTVIPSFLGKLTDTIDRRYFILGGSVFGIIGPIISGRASSMEMIIGGQVLTGVGISLGYLAIPFTVEVVPKQKRPYVQGISSIFAGIAYSTGGPIAGAFIKHSVGGINNGWRCGFYSGSGFSFISFVLLLFFYHPLPRANPNNLSVFRRLLVVDWIGVGLAASGLTIFLVGLESGGNPYAWSSARVLAPLMVGFFCLVLFVLWEWKGPTTGLLDHGLFHHRNFGLTLVLNFVSGMVLFGGQAYIPREIITLFTSDAVLTGVYSLPFNVTTIVGGGIGGIIMALTREGRTLVISSFLLMVIASGLMAIMEPHYNFAAWFFPTAMLGTAVGVQTALLIIIVTICTPNHLIATAVNVANATRSLGGSIGVVIFGQIFSKKVAHFLSHEVTAAALEAGLPKTSLLPLFNAIALQSVEAFENVPGISSAIMAKVDLAVRQSYADGFRYVWYSLLPFAVLCLLLSWFLKSTKAQMTQQIAAGVEHRH